MLLIDIKTLQNHAEKIMDFEHPTLTGEPIKIIHESRHFMRFLLLNINYLQYQNITKTTQKNITDFEHPT